LGTVLAKALRDNFEINPSEISEFIPYLIATLISALVVLPVTGLDRMVWRFSSRFETLRIAAAMAAVTLGAVLLTFAFNRLDGVPRSLPFLQLLTCQAFLVGARTLHRVSHDSRRRRKASAAFLRMADKEPEDNVLIVGISKLTELYLQAVADHGPGRMKVVGLVGRADRHAGRLVAAQPVLGVASEIETILDSLEVHGVRIGRIVVAAPFPSLTGVERDALLRVERTRGIALDFLAEVLRLDGDGRSAVPQAPGARSEAGRSAELSFEIGPDELAAIARRRYWTFKRAFDCLAALALFVFGSPFMVIAAVATFVSIGMPVIFWQERPGLGGRPFRLYKFRSMRAAHARDGRRLSDEERVSSIGNFMRRLRFDELPQLVNIIRGDMGFIGPRPLLASEQQDAHRARLLVRPGLTGWAQVVGGRDISPEDKAALDVWYVRNASLALDLKIAAKTVPMVLLGERISKPLIERAWRDLSEEGILKGDLAFTIENRLNSSPFPL
jgi:lipopolysaccharide/colanic/teichoic acid biosynthesis glycosyltransferase